MVKVSTGDRTRETEEESEGREERRRMGLLLKEEAWLRVQRSMVLENRRDQKMMLRGGWEARRGGIEKGMAGCRFELSKGGTVYPEGPSSHEKMLRDDVRNISVNFGDAFGDSSESESEEGTEGGVHPEP